MLKNITALLFFGVAMTSCNQAAPPTPPESGLSSSEGGTAKKTTDATTGTEQVEDKSSTIASTTKQNLPLKVYEYGAAILENKTRENVDKCARNFGFWDRKLAKCIDNSAVLDPNSESKATLRCNNWEDMAAHTAIGQVGVDAIKKAIATPSNQTTFVPDQCQDKGTFFYLSMTFVAPDGAVQLRRFCINNPEGCPAS